MAGTRFAFLDHPGCIPFAHRGGAFEAPENTWTSFGHARDLGFQYMETDVHASSDGVVLTIHDATLDRVSDRKGLVRETTWQDLAQVRLYGDEAIPRLDELLATWPEIRWNIDVKHDSAVDPLVACVRKTDALERVCVTSFSDRRVARIRRELGPRLCMAPGPASVTSLRLTSLLPPAIRAHTLAGLSRFGAIQVPLRQWRVPVVDHRLVQTARRLGLHVHVWTVDDDATMETLLELGVDGIMTDRPSLLKAVLDRHGRWP